MHVIHYRVNVAKNTTTELRYADLRTGCYMEQMHIFVQLTYDVNIFLVILHVSVRIHICSTSITTG